MLVLVWCWVCAWLGGCVLVFGLLGLLGLLVRVVDGVGVSAVFLGVSSECWG